MNHIVKSFDRDLDEVLAEVTAMGKLVREQLVKAADALQKLDADEARSVMVRDAEVNGCEVAVDAKIESVFARRQPAARDLRMLIGMSRVSVDFERMGDEIRNMAGSVLELKGLDASLLENRSAIIMAVDTVAHMIDDSILALSRLDTDLAREIIDRDHLVDDVYKTALRSLIVHMMQDPSSIEGAIALTWIGRSLERVGDHVKNVCEAVVYIKDGADVRHEFYTQKAPVGQNEPAEDGVQH